MFASVFRGSGENHLAEGYPKGMEPTTLAYMAGLIDGEGSVSLDKNYNSSDPDLYRIPSLTVASTTPAIVDFCKSHFGGSISTKKVYQDHHKPSFVWALRHQQAVALLIELLPFMLEPEKIRRADLLIRFQAERPRNGKYSAECLQSLRELVEEFRLQ